MVVYNQNLLFHIGTLIEIVYDFFHLCDTFIIGFLMYYFKIQQKIYGLTLLKPRIPEKNLKYGLDRKSVV